MSNTRFVSHRDLTQQKLLELVKADLQGRWENLLHNCIYFSGQASKHSSPIILPLALKNLTTNDEPSMLVSEQSSLIEVFDKKEIEGQLLILGESGSGKTTILLQLAQILVSRAEQDERQPIPILLNLSVEKNPQQTFKQWLIKNLKVVYGIRPDIAQKWLEESAIIPLLDGLDRLTPEHRQRCVQNINQFLAHESWSNSFIVCDRLPQNSSQENQLNLNYCLILQPLNISQIQDCLSDSDSKNLEGVIHNNPNLRVLAKVPLFLNMMIICSEQITFHQWELIDSVDKTRQQLLTIYCQKRLKQLPQKNVREKLMERWLGWLATQLKRNGFSDFRLEYLQPYWLKNGEEQLMYGAIFGIISGLIYASSIFVILIRIILLTYSSLQQAWAILALFVSMAGITFMMLIMGFIYGLRVNIMPFTEFDSLSPLNARKLLKHNLIRGLIYGLIARSEEHTSELQSQQ